MKKFYLFLSLFLVSLHANAQTLEATTYEVTYENELLPYPFAGGMNNPQTYTADLNNDGLIDLVTMDRDGGAMIPFLRIDNGENTSFKYAPEYKNSFPNVTEWFVLRDFNNDGIMDLFCFPQSNFFGIEIRKGFYSNDTLRFELVEFNEIIGAPDILPVPSGSSSFTNLLVNSNDQPEIIDLDGDGDMDVVTFDPGGSHLNYFKNFALEKGLGLDTFSMELEDACWGRFFENGMSSDISLSSSQDTCASLFQDPTADDRHAGSCTTIFDENGDGIYDVLLGDLTNANMVLLTNTVDSEEAWMTASDNTFPSYDVPIDIDIFNAAFYIDVNNDNKRDLLASPNANANVDNYNVNWYYKNVGTDENPFFEYRKQDFLVEGMLDFGAGSKPVFVDANQDGLMDIVVGARGRYLGNGANDTKLFLLENRGTLSEPVFELVDDNYAGYQQNPDFPVSLSLHPAFGDLDGDGDIDLLVGDNHGFLYYSENIAGEGNPFEFASSIYEFMDIRPGNISNPFIYDLNQDGLGDIVIGERNNVAVNGFVGGLNFYPNIGTVGNPMFEGEEEIDPNIQAFGAVNTQTIFDVTGQTAPYFYLQGDELLLFAGSKSGNIHVYDNILNNLDGQFNLLDADFGDLNEGEETTVAVYDIDNDLKLERLVGNERGGLAIFNTDILSSDELSSEDLLEFNVSIFPNPVTDVLEIKGEEIFQYQMIDVTGRVLAQGNVFLNQQLDLSNINPGVYFIKCFNKGKESTQKFVKI